MNTLIKALLGASVFSLASLASAVDSGVQQSVYDIDGGSLGSGDGSGGGTWGLTTFRNGDISISIADTATQITTLTGTIVESTLNLSYTAATGTWSGTSTPTKCTRSGGLFDGCGFIALNVPVSVYDIVVDLDDDNLGTISQKSSNTAAGVTAITTVTYTLTAE